MQDLLPPVSYVEVEEHGLLLWVDFLEVVEHVRDHIQVLLTILLVIGLPAIVELTGGRALRFLIGNLVGGLLTVMTLLFLNFCYCVIESLDLAAHWIVVLLLELKCETVQLVESLG